MIVFAALVSSLPGLFGGLLLCAFRRVGKDVPLPILFSLGCYLGFILLSAVIDLAKSFEIHISGLWLAAIVAVLSFVLFVSIAKSGVARSTERLEVRPSGRVVRASWLIPVLYALIFSGFVSIQLAMAPASAWDVLGSWSYHARQLIDQGLVGGVIGSYGDSQNHPTASTTLLAWASWASHEAGAPGLWPWLLAAVAIWLTIYGYGIFCQQPLGGAIVATAIVMTPLVENHVALPGYAEIWLMQTSVVAAALMAISLKTQRFSIIALAIVAALLCIWTRKTGIANSAVLIFGYAVALCIAPSSPRAARALLCMAALVSVAMVFIVTGFQFSIAGVYTHWDPQALKLDFAGRRLELEWQGLRQVLANELSSKWINVSFSTIFLAAVTASLLVGLKWLRSRSDATAGVFLVFAFFGNVFLLMLAQLFSADGMSIAKPSMDTGNSRYFLPAAGIAGLLLIESIAMIQRTPRINREVPIAER